jgi:hypothetical protein
VFDDYGNSYQLNGVVSGTLVSINLGEGGGAATATGLGAVSGNRIQGALTGRMVFDAGRVCELTPESVFIVELGG